MTPPRPSCSRSPSATDRLGNTRPVPDSNRRGPFLVASLELGNPDSRAIKGSRKELVKAKRPLGNPDSWAVRRREALAERQEARWVGAVNARRCHYAGRCAGPPVPAAPRIFYFPNPLLAGRDCRAAARRPRLATTTYLFLFSQPCGSAPGVQGRGVKGNTITEKEACRCRLAETRTPAGPLVATRPRQMRCLGHPESSGVLIGCRG